MSNAFGFQLHSNVPSNSSPSEDLLGEPPSSPANVSQDFPPYSPSKSVHLSQSSDEEDEEDESVGDTNRHHHQEECNAHEANDEVPNICADEAQHNEPGGEPPAADNNMPDDEEEHAVGNRNENERQARNPQLNRDLLRHRMQGPYMGNIDMPVIASRNDLLYMTLGMAKRSNHNNTEFNNTIQFVNTIFAAPVLPQSSYLLDNLLLGNMDVEYHFYCRSCFKYFGILDYENTKTHLCGNHLCRTVNVISDLRVASFFVIFDIPIQVQVVLNKNGNKNFLLTPAEAVARSEQGFLTGIWSSSKYREFAASLGAHDDHVISFKFGTDGAAIAVSSKFSIWPIQAEIIELPTDIRQSNLILCGLWFGVKHARMDLFLGPFVNKMQRLSRGYQITVENDVWNCRSYAIGCCVDSGARGAVQGIKTHSGYSSCNWCVTTGEWIGGAVRFPERRNDISRKRTHEELVRLQRALAENPNLQQENVLEEEEEELSDDEEREDHDDPLQLGVNAISPLINLPKFNIVDGFFVEAMHLLDLGLTKAFLSKWLGDYGYPYYIKDLSPEINRRIMAIRPPVEFRRLPRDLSTKAHWNARENHNFGMYLCVPVLNEYLPRRFLKVWQLFMQANYLLNRQKVSDQDVRTADVLISKFREETQLLYDDTDMTYNMHIYKHLPADTANWGQSFDTSAYSLESGNGDLKDLIHSVQGIPNQIIRALSWNLALDLLEPVVSQKARDFVKDLFVPKRNKQTSIKVGDVRLKGKPAIFYLTQEERYLCEQQEHEIDNLECYKKIIVKECVFTEEREGGRTDNSVAMLVDNSIILIRKILFDRESSVVFCLASVVNWEPTFVPPPGVRLAREDHFMRKITSINEEMIYVPSDDLKIICFRGNLQGEGDYVAPFPHVHNRF